MADNINQRLFDEFLKRDIDLMRLEAGTDREVTQSVSELIRLLTVAVLSNDPTEPSRSAFRARRLAKIIEESRGIIRDHYRSLYRSFRGHLVSVGQDEIAAFGESLSTGLGIQLGPREVPVSEIRAMIDEQVITANVNDAATLRDFYEREAAAHHRRFRSTLTKGFHDGDTLTQLITRVRQAHGVQNREATAVARTAYNHVINQTRLAMTLRNRFIFRGVVWVSVLDGNTTPVCISRSNGMWDLNRRVLPESPFRGPFRVPPIHFACRSQLYPLTQTRRQLGRGSDEARRILARLPDEQRRLLSADPPVQESYPDWLRGQSEAVQLRVLGRSRRELWLQGQLNLRELTTQQGRTLTLRELANRRKRAA